MIRRMLQNSAGCGGLVGCLAAIACLGACSPGSKVTPPMLPQTDLQWMQTSCSVTRTECTGMILEQGQDAGSDPEPNCPLANQVTTSFIATQCYQEPVADLPAQQQTFATDVCQRFCDDPAGGGLWPLAHAQKAQGASSGLSCVASVFDNDGQPEFNQALPGACATVGVGQSVGETAFATCSLSGRECEQITTSGGLMFCGSLPQLNVTESGCFDPTMTSADSFCQNGLEFPALTQGGPGVLDMFPYWDVSGVALLSDQCPASGGSGAAALGITPGTVGSVTGGGTTTPLIAIGGSMGVKTKCDSDNEFCTSTITALTIQLADVTIAGVTIHNPLATMVGAPTASVFGTIEAQSLRLQIEGDIAGLGHVSTVVSNPQSLTIGVGTTSASLAGSVSGVISTNGTTVMPVSGTLSVGGSTSAPGAACNGETAIQRLLGFETTAEWFFSQGTGSLTVTPALHTQGCYGIAVNGSGYRTLESAPFVTPLPGTTSQLALDIYVPGGQPNPYWQGAVQTYLTCPSANFFNQYIGQVELTGLPTAQISTVKFAVPAPIEAMLAGAHPDCSFGVAVNTNATPTPPVLDNLRFQ